MSTLIILILSFLVLWRVNKYVFRDRYTLSALGRVALATMLMFTGAAHFFKTAEMVQMIPEFLPYKTELVYFTGIFELLAAVGLTFPQTARGSSFALIIFMILVVPANVIGSLKSG